MAIPCKHTLRQKPAARGRHTHCGTNKDKIGIAERVWASKRFRNVLSTVAASLDSHLNCKTATCRKRKREGTGDGEKLGCRDVSSCFFCIRNA